MQPWPKLGRDKVWSLCDQGLEIIPTVTAFDFFKWSTFHSFFYNRLSTASLKLTLESYLSVERFYARCPDPLLQC